MPKWLARWRATHHAMNLRELALTALAALGVACQAGSSASPGASGPQPPFLVDGSEHAQPAGSCARRGTDPVSPEGREGSAIAVARTMSGLVAYVADQEGKALHVVDVGAARLAGTVRLGGTPRQVLVLEDGRVVVSLIDEDRVDVLEPAVEPPGSLRLLCSRAVPAGPFGLAASADGRKLVVTSTWAGTVSVFETERMTVSRVIATERAPAGVTLPAGDRAFVSHVSGAHLTVADLEGGVEVHRTVDLRVRAATPVGRTDALGFQRLGSQAFALASVVVSDEPRPGSEGPTAITGAAPPAITRRKPRPAGDGEPRTLVIVPMVSIDPGEMSRPRDIYYGPPPTLGVPKQAPVSVVVDPISEQALTRHVVAISPDARRAECYLPRGVAFRRSTERLYVACRGSDQLLELDARVADPMRTPLARFEVPRGAAGVAVVDREGLALAYGELARAVRLFRLDGGPGAEIALPPDDSISPAVRLGRELFHRTDDERIASDGLACASCHPDGREDGLTWATPEGPRQTIMLAGRVAGTAPYGWTREQATLEAYIEDTTRRLGRGIDRADAAALAAYVTSLRGPSRSASADALAQGASVFASAGCAGCHTGDTSTDRRQHDIGGGPLDTPSLRYVGLTAPYFHDGRYPSLEALLDGGDHGMGDTKSLSADDRRSLRTYLESL